MARGPGAEAVVDGNLYLNWNAGLAFSKPEGWDFETPVDPRRTFGGVLVDAGEGQSTPVGDLFDPLGGQPLFIVSKSSVAREIVGAHGPDDDTLAPMLCVAYEGNCEDDPPLSLLRRVEEVLPFYVEAFRECKVVSAPHGGALSDCESVEYTITFLFGHQNLPEWIPTRERVMWVAQDPAIYSVHMYDFPAVSPELVEDFDPILRVFRLA